MITAEELNVIAKKYRKKRESTTIRGMIFGYSALFSFPIFMLLCWLFGVKKETVLVIFWIFLVVIIFIIIFLSIKIEKKIERNFGYLCPNCGKQLARHAGIVIASGICPNCMKKVINKNDEPQ